MSTPAQRRNMFDVGAGVGAVVFYGSTLLMMQRGEQASHGAGMWTVPGGWIDYGETPGQAAMREVSEETDLVVQSRMAEAWLATCALHPEGLQSVTIWVPCDIESQAQPKVMEPGKIARVEWVAIRDIPDLPLWAPFQTWWRQQ
mgnify:CR=1 FL=1